MTQVEVEPTAAAAAARAAAVIAGSLRDAVAERGRASLALSGGGTGLALLDALAPLDVPWPAVTILQVDERVAPAGSPERNASGLRARLLDRLVAAPAAVELLPVEDADRGAAVRAAGDAFAAHLPLDVVHLGLGADGHTASWPPGTDPGSLDVQGWVAAVPAFNGFERLTMTPAAVARSRLVVALVTDADKAPVVARWLAGDPDLPASAIPTEHLVVVLAEAASPAG